MTNCFFDAIVVLGGIFTASFWQAVYSGLAVLIIALMISFAKKRLDSEYTEPVPVDEG